MTISKAFRKYGIDNFTFEMIEECAVDALPEREKFWVAQLRPEYNRSEGGIGPIGYIQSPETKAILSAKAKEQWRRMTPEERRQRVESNLTGPKPGHTRSWEMRKRISATLTGRKLGPFSEERRELQRQAIHKRGAAWGMARWKQVASVNQKGRVVWFYPAVTIAAADVGVNPSSITQVLKGRKKTAGGYRWFYAGVDALGPTDRPFYQEAKPI